MPFTPELLNLLLHLRANEVDETREMLSRLADHWHFRRGDRDKISTGDGIMAVLGLALTPAEAENLTQRLQAAGLPPELLVECLATPDPPAGG